MGIPVLNVIFNVLYVIIALKIVVIVMEIEGLE